MEFSCFGLILICSQILGNFAHGSNTANFSSSLTWNSTLENSGTLPNSSRKEGIEAPVTGENIVNFGDTTADILGRDFASIPSNAQDAMSCATECHEPTDISVDFITLKDVCSCMSVLFSDLKANNISDRRTMLNNDCCMSSESTTTRNCPQLHPDDLGKIVTSCSCLDDLDGPQIGNSSKDMNRPDVVECCCSVVAAFQETKAILHSEHSEDNVTDSETRAIWNKGLFNPSHLEFNFQNDGARENRTEPTLVEMTKKAIEVLQKDRNGFFLLVEGARIDFGHHANSAFTAITETLELDEAVKQAVRMTSSKDTLIMVTADHSHAFAIQGYAPRGRDILATANPSSESSPLDGLPYTTLGYTNGPVFGRADLSGVDTASPSFRQAGCIPLGVETHAGEDVSVYALGPMSHLFHATHEQNYLYHVMEYAACVGRSKKYCSFSRAHGRGP